MSLPTLEEVKQIIADNPKMCWYTLGHVDLCAAPGQTQEIRDVMSAARPKCGYHCREKKCPVSGERSR